MGQLPDQRDLARLPEPRFISTAPRWLRVFAACVLGFGVLMGAAVLARGLGEGGRVWVALGGAVAAGVCLFVLVRGRPMDWRAWINVAATPDGLYVVTPSRRAVFVPWRDVLAMEVEKRPSRHGMTSYPRLTLRLPEAAWAAFGRLSGITGTGEVRQYLMSALVKPGDELIAALRDFRAAHART